MTKHPIQKVYWIIFPPDLSNIRFFHFSKKRFTPHVYYFYPRMQKVHPIIFCSKKVQRRMLLNFENRFVFVIAAAWLIGYFKAMIYVLVCLRIVIAQHDDCAYIS